MNAEPVIVTRVPGAPLVGENDVIVAATAKFAVLVALPAGVVTPILPVVAPAGTVAVILMAELTVNAAAVPLKATAVAPVKFAPLMTTLAPTAPLAGVKPVIRGRHHEAGRAGRGARGGRHADRAARGVRRHRERDLTCRC